LSVTVERSGDVCDRDPRYRRSQGEAAQALQLPEGTTLHTVSPNEDGTRAVCLWEAGSVGVVEAIVEGGTGDVSTNEYFAVNDASAVGLPAAAAAATG
jgi:hypothetical protein